MAITLESTLPLAARLAIIWKLATEIIVFVRPPRSLQETGWAFCFSSVSIADQSKGLTPMLLRSLALLRAITACSSPSYGQYHVSVRAFAGGTQGHFPGADTLRYEFYPNVSLFSEVDSMTYEPSAAFLTMISPLGVLSGYDNHPLGYTETLDYYASSSDLLDEVHGTCNLTIEDAGNTYVYEVDIVFALLFAELPRLTSTSLVNGNLVVDFDWALEGGNEHYPDSSNQLFAVSLNTLTFEEVAAAFLPASASTWSPPVSITGDQDFVARVGTFQVATDYDSLQVTEVRSLTPAAPALTFVLNSVEYTANLTVRLTPLVVPEPSSVATALIATVAVACTRRRSKQAH